MASHFPGIVGIGSALIILTFIYKIGKWIYQKIKIRQGTTAANSANRDLERNLPAHMDSDSDEDVRAIAARGRSMTGNTSVADEGNQGTTFSLTDRSTPTRGRSGFSLFRNVPL